MSLKDDRKLSLALTFARLQAVDFMLAGAINAESSKVVDRSEVVAMRARLKVMCDQCWRAMRPDGEAKT